MVAIPNESPWDVDKQFLVKKMYFSTIKFGLTADYKFKFERHTEVISSFNIRKRFNM